jgi:hypothetical protein
MRIILTFIILTYINILSTLTHASTLPSFVLDQILPRIQHNQAQNITSILVFDLDETLILTSARKAVALKSTINTTWINNCTPPSHLSFTAAECESLKNTLPLLSARGLNQSQNAYDLSSYLKQLGLTLSAEHESQIKQQAIDLYMQPTEMDLDTEIPGAQRFIQFLLHEPRVKIFYVSSRFKETQQTATLKSLKKLGLLRKKRNTDDLLLEPTLFLRNLNQSSIEFKTTAFNAIQNWQTHSDVIAVFENEPENMNAMTSIFSQAEAYFMEGAFLKNEPILPSVHHLQDYL